jgi:hypothetical protein
MKTTKKYITLRAAFQRLNRKLAHDNKRVRVYGAPRAIHREFVLVDLSRGVVLDRWDAFPVALARKVGALADWEEVK